MLEFEDQMSSFIDKCLEKSLAHKKGCVLPIIVKD